LGFAEIARFDGVVALDALTNSQFETEFVLVVTLKLMGVVSVLVRATFWNELVVEPCGTVKDTELGLATRSDVLLTTNVTGMVCGVLGLPLVVTEIDPWYVPGNSPVGIIDTTKLPGAVPAVGDTLSQLWPLFVVAARLYPSTPVGLPTVTD
jgi:hypothetical protein